MNKFSHLCLFLTAAATLAAACQSPAPEPLKPRIVVLTDIGPAEVEPHRRCALQSCGVGHVCC